MTTFSENPRAAEFIVSEANGTLSREAGVLAEGNVGKAGQVLGFIPSGTSASAAKAGGNTGAGTLTLDATTPILPGAKEGVYTVRCITAASGNGTFRVRDPDGDVLGDVVMAAGAGAFADQIKFALADGDPDFAVGDGFDITISALTGKYANLDVAETDGSQVATAILYAPVDATDADMECVVFARNGEVNEHLLTWPAGISAANKAIAKSRLAARGIICRD